MLNVLLGVYYNLCPSQPTPILQVILSKVLTSNGLGIKMSSKRISSSWPFPKRPTHLQHPTQHQPLDVLTGISRLTWLGWNWPEPLGYNNHTTPSPGKGMRHADQGCFITTAWGASGRWAPACRHYLWMTVWQMICTWSQRVSWKAVRPRLTVWQENAEVASRGPETPVKTLFWSSWSHGVLSIHQRFLIQGKSMDCGCCRTVPCSLTVTGGPMNLLWALQVARVVKNPSTNARDIRVVGSIPGLGRPLEEGMATHASILAWRIPWTEEPGGLRSTGSQSVRHDRSDLACTHAGIFFSNQSLSKGHYQSPKLSSPGSLPHLRKMKTAFS